MSSEKAKAARKMITGAGQVISGVVTGTGHGVVGGMCRNSGMMSGAQAIGRQSLRNGQKKFNEGLKEWKEADR